MTQEEVIKYLNTLYMALAVFPNQQISLGNINEMKESVNMAIKALEQELCEDAISKQAVLDMMQLRLSAKELYKAVYDLPPVTPTRKQGKWVTKFHGFPPEPYAACSNCDYDIDFEISKLVKADAFTIKPYRPKFCPNCGSEMEGYESEVEK